MFAGAPDNLMIVTLKDRYILASNFQAKSQLLSVLSAKIKWKSRSSKQRTALI